MHIWKTCWRFFFQICQVTNGRSQGIAFRLLPPAGHLVVERITPGSPAEALHLPKVHGRRVGTWSVHGLGAHSYSDYVCIKITERVSACVLLDGQMNRQIDR